MREQDDREPDGQDPGAGRDPFGGSRGGWSIEDVVTQLRGLTDRARDLAAGAVPGSFSLPRLPSPPGAMSAAQLRAIHQAVVGQRRLVEGMTTQLQAFDEQLALFERVLEPLVEWSSTWARLEESVAEFVRGPAAAGASDAGPFAGPAAGQGPQDPSGPQPA